jgi:dipeptidyl aminopeptidase/acylaminoacyl peptidase
MKHNLLFVFLLSYWLASCGPEPAPVTLLPPDKLVPTLQLVFPVGKSTATPAPGPSPTPPPVPTTPPEEYASLTIESLAKREYGEGLLLGLGVLEETDTFTRRLVSYPSDGLTINGFVNIPEGEGPFPVVIVLHGYINPSVYQVQTYTTRYADAFTKAGYLTIHPNYRNYPPSDVGENLFRVGFAIDILNLVHIVEKQAGEPGILETAQPGAIFLWGHSMGGGITLRVLTVGAPVNAAVLYGAMSGDERQNFEQIFFALSEGSRGIEELAVAQEVMDVVSPINYLERIDTPISIHHGRSDDVVPLIWSLDLCEALEAFGKPVECFFYNGMPHTFWGNPDLLLFERSLEFFEWYMP